MARPELPNGLVQLRPGVSEYIPGIRPPLAEEVLSSELRVPLAEEVTDDIPMAQFPVEGVPLVTEEVLDDPPWVNVVASSYVWAYRAVAPGDYMTLGVV